VTDVRDVIFQSDPFADVPQQFLWVFQESDAYKIADDNTNSTWIRRAYGDNVFKKICDNGILCAGTTLGSTGLVVRYLERMCSELVRLTPLIAGEFGFDQGALNYLCWTGRLPDAEIKRNFLGPVATLKLEREENFRFDADGRLLNRDGCLIPVLHQYDCHPILLQKLACL
jgi:hypothetical protein